MTRVVASLLHPARHQSSGGRLSGLVSNGDTARGALRNRTLRYSRLINARSTRNAGTEYSKPLTTKVLPAIAIRTAIPRILDTGKKRSFRGNSLTFVPMARRNLRWVTRITIHT